MRILPPFEEKIRSKIRDELAKKPTLSISALKDQLEIEFGRDFHHTYVTKLVHKISKEQLQNVDRTKIQERINFTRENYRMMRERLLEIIY